jgi:hypothetical protein
MISTIKKPLLIFCSIVLTVPNCLFSVEKATFSAQHNGITLEVTDCTINPSFYNKHYNIGTPLVPEIGVQDLTQKGMHPIRIMIYNTSTEPVVIAPNSFRMKLADLKQLEEFFPHEETAAIILLSIFLLYPAGFLAVLEGGHGNNLLPFSLSNYPVTSAWTASALMGCFYLREALAKDRLKRITKLGKYFLSEPIVVQPGKMVQKLVLLDGKSFHSCFHVRIFNQDQTDYAATFDVELI